MLSVNSLGSVATSLCFRFYATMKDNLSFATNKGNKFILSDNGNLSFTTNNGIEFILPGFKPMSPSFVNCAKLF